MSADDDIDLFMGLMKHKVPSRNLGPLKQKSGGSHSVKKLAALGVENKLHAITAENTFLMRAFLHAEEKDTAPLDYKFEQENAAHAYAKGGIVPSYEEGKTLFQTEVVDRAARRLADFFPGLPDAKSKTKPATPDSPK